MRKHLGSRTRQQGKALTALAPVAPAPVAAPPANPFANLRGLPNLGYGYGFGAHMRNAQSERRHRADPRVLSLADQQRLTHRYTEARELAATERAKRVATAVPNRLR